MQRITASLLLAAMTGVLSVSLQAEEPKEQSWVNLESLRIGDQIEVVDTSSSSKTGSFLGFSDEAISLKIRDESLKVPRFDVVRVKSREHSRRWRNALIGAAIGAGAGLVAGILAGENYHESGETGLFLLITLPVGAGAGAATGAAFPSYPDVYKRPSGSPAP
ncbi:MAG: hypothetical protein AB1714_18715 [Acidobacteriota bacterium]